MVSPLRILSLGAGVQSSTLGMMMVHGEIEKAAIAIFADTGAESEATYKWLGWLAPKLETAGIKFIQVMQGQGLTNAIEEACKGITKRSSNVPLFTENGGRIFRQCTWDFKVLAIRREAKKYCKKAVMVRGISFDERHRATPCTDVKWITHEHPLVDMGMTRQDCALWMLRHGYPIPPRSACVYCPNRCNAEWQRMKDLSPQDWKEAQRMDTLMRSSLPNLKERVYVHRQCVPLAEADLFWDVDKDQLPLGGDGWADCEGMCGL